MITKTLFSLTLSLLSFSLLSAADEPFTPSHEKINQLSIIPKQKTGGIDAFQGSSKLKQHKRDDAFDELGLATQGNQDASVLSGLNIEANKPKEHAKDYKRPRIG